jgi:hypothetical protein
MVLGYRVGSQKAVDQLLKYNIGTSQIELRSNLKLAELLKMNQKEKTEELLEKFIDQQVINLGFQANNKTFTAARKDIIDAIHDAREYRQKWPSPNHKPDESTRKGLEGT